MTRINLVNPRELSDQHLVAEYREIFMVGSSLQRSIKSKNWLKTQNRECPTRHRTHPPTPQKKIDSFDPLTV